MATVGQTPRNEYWYRTHAWRHGEEQHSVVLLLREAGPGQGLQRVNQNISEIKFKNK